MIRCPYGTGRDKQCHENDLGLNAKTPISSPRLSIPGQIKIPTPPEAFLGSFYCWGPGRARGTNPLPLQV